MTAETIVIVGGGQSGLAAARAARDSGLRPVVLEAGDRPVGSWPSYYDSLTLFSPARFSGFPGAPFPGVPDRYPTRDEVVEFLDRYAASLGVEVHTNTRVQTVEHHGGRFTVHAEDGRQFEAAAVIAASGSFGNPYRPVFPGVFGGEILHVADYRTPKEYAGQRVVVVGAGNSAVQIAYELAEVAQVTLATRAPVQFVPQLRGGRDTHYWLHALRLDLLPRSVLTRLVKKTLVFDTGSYAKALQDGAISRREVFTNYTETGVVYPNGHQEPADTVILATGYRPHLPYLRHLGALTPAGEPKHRQGLSTTHPGLAYLGLEFQRTFASNTLRGIHRDATYIVNALTTHLSG